MIVPRSIRDLSEALNKLPGVGPKMSMRLALYLSVSNKSLASELSNKLSAAVSNISLCTICHNITENDICSICSDESRDHSKIMIVETPLELFSLEDSDIYKGMYHVLHGVISPMNGIGPDDIKIDSLLHRLESNDINELIIGLNPNLESDSTSLFIRDRINNSSISITKLAKGIPSGSNIEYMSSGTLRESLESRTSL